MPIQITEKNWLNYLRALEKINEGAAEKVTDYLSEHEILSEEGRKNFLDYFYAIVTKYGEGSAEMACQMYDATAKAQGANVPPAEPAPTATYPETARAVNGSLFDSPSGAKLPGTAKRLVKQAGVDTTMKNAIRDGAEWAWVPHGDTCAFCLMMASNGWQRASKNALKKGHAQHIHGNCDCTYATRHDGKSSVKGYDPDKYKAMYDNAEGDRWQDKRNSMRRDLYAENKDRINEQKRIAYSRRKEHGDAYCYGDYLREVLGSARENHEEELQMIVDDVKRKGGDVIFLKNSTKMVTNLRRGEPAIIEMDENVSIAAARHEYRHFLDDLENGSPGFAYYLRDEDIFFKFEKRGYEEELAIARAYGYNDIEEKIRGEIEKRRKEIYGVE
ncbi:MAG: hypothetical protein K5707_04230 [Clostridia bacterium]|nr:hypothetical protein [Clostridia bacterium]